MEDLFPDIKNRVTVIWYFIIMACYGVAVFIFRPSFYYENHIFDIIFGLLLTPIIIYFISFWLYIILKYIIAKAHNVNDTAILIIVIIVSLAGWIYMDCQPKACDYQYIVNIYDDKETNQCVVGYADIDSMADEDGGWFSIYAIYIDDERIYVDDYDTITKIEFSSGKRYEVHDEEKTYYVEFIRKKTANKTNK